MNLADIDLLDLDRFHRGEHHEMFRVLRAEAPMWWQQVRGGGFWNVVRHADLVTVNRDAARFSSERKGINIFDLAEVTEAGVADPREAMMLYMDPPKHTRFRLLVNKGFTPRMVSVLEQFLRRRSTAIVDRVIERGECDVVADLSAELPLQAIAEIMGVPEDDRANLFRWTQQTIDHKDQQLVVLTERVTGRRGADEPIADPEGYMQATGALYGYIEQLAADRRADPRDDIMSKLVDAEIDGDKLTALELDMFMMLLTSAGTETTTHTTAAGLLALVQNPDQFEALRSKPELLDSAVEEMLRWASPVLHFRRTATSDTEVAGHPIAEGDAVVLWYVSANRDEEAFDDPDTFDVSRSPNPHVTFGGGGPHLCLGAPLARLELKAIFREILDRIDNVELAGEPEILKSNLIGGITRMPIRFTPGKRILATR